MSTIYETNTNLTTTVPLVAASALASSLWLARSVAVTLLLVLGVALVWLDSRRHRRGCGIAADVVGVVWLVVLVVGLLLLVP
jgi:hypothetical protein